MTGILLAIFLGWAGGYRFYKKQYGMGILYLCTFGLFYVGWVIDIVKSVKEYFRLKDERREIGERLDAKAKEEQQQEETRSTHINTKSKGEFFLHSSKDTDKNISQLNERFIVVDTETTGVNTAEDRIVSIAAIIIENGQPVDTFYTLVNPNRHIPEEATRINHITDQMVQAAPSEKEACIEFLAFCGDAIFSKTLFVAYNSSFDFTLIKHAMERNGLAGNVRHFDVLAFARKKLQLPNYKQTTVAEYYGLDTSNAHDALGDCKMCAEILLKLLEN